MKIELLIQRLTSLKDEADHTLQHILLDVLTSDDMEEMIGALSDTIRLCQQWLEIRREVRNREQISFSDNSHIIGKPLKVWEETHLLLEGKRVEALQDVQHLALLLGHSVEIHAVYEQERR